MQSTVRKSTVSHEVMGLANLSSEKTATHFDLRIYNYPHATDFSSQTPVGFFERDIATLDSEMKAALGDFQQDFENLVTDQYMRDNSTYRLRRFGLFKLDPSNQETPVSLLPPKPFYQDTNINAYSGGIAREYAPLEQHTINNVFLKHLMLDIYAMLPASVKTSQVPWEIGVHLMRIIGVPGTPGFPAPEGLHHDGHEFTSITLIKRHNVAGATSIFTDLDKNIFLEKTLSNILDTVIFDDSECMHDVTPVASRDNLQLAVRDVCGFSLNPIVA